MTHHFSRDTSGIQSRIDTIKHIAFMVTEFGWHDINSLKEDIDKVFPYGITEDGILYDEESCIGREEAHDWLYRRLGGSGLTFNPHRDERHFRVDESELWLFHESLGYRFQKERHFYMFLDFLQGKH